MRGLFAIWRLNELLMSGDMLADVLIFDLSGNRMLTGGCH